MLFQHARVVKGGSGIDALGVEREVPLVAKVEQEIQAHPRGEGQLADLDGVGEGVVGMVGQIRVIDVDGAAEAVLVAGV